MTSEDWLPNKEICNYYAPWPVYALDWTKQPHDQSFRLAVGSFLEQSGNKVQVIQYSPHAQSRADSGLHNGRGPELGGIEGTRPNGGDPGVRDGRGGVPTPTNTDFVVLAEADHAYPATKTLWSPNPSLSGDLLATSGDFLRLWEVPRGSSYHDQHQPSNLHLKATLSNSKGDFCAPLTSFDWNEIDVTRLVTCSIDTTCTVWDVSTQQPKTQLIAHDKEVYDVAFSTGSTEVFASVGADGSIRMFDLRALERSTILYEAPPTVTANPNPPPSATGPAGGAVAKVSPPLMRLDFNKKNPNYIATFAMDSSTVQIVDVRVPGLPISELRGHNGSVNSLTWAPHQQNMMCSAGDDLQVLVWDLSRSPLAGGSAVTDIAKHVVDVPSLTYRASAEVSTVSWSRAVPDWVAISFGRTVQTLRV
ncbi:hypothetical protein IWQ62_002622 [Dispira parvispora]|uniref:WD40 repeat-like protein n=1 Tax=Dispira parvispora TaxID=1520584 RepID=A0A9W8AVD1_9FUNG|nr:hypothetical protein IWQ62_002622 [Dispira parvispora]